MHGFPYRGVFGPGDFRGLGEDAGSTLRRGRSSRVAGGRGSLAGVNLRSDGCEFPRLSRSHYDKLMFFNTATPTDAKLQVFLGRLVKPGSQEWLEYFSRRTGRCVEEPNGTKVYSVVSNVNPVYVPPSDRVFSVKRSNDKVKTYTLAQVLGDVYIREKYDIPLKVISDVQTLMVNEPMDAAATMQEYLQSRSPNVKIKVSAASSMTSVSNAVRTIQGFARTLRRVIGIDSEVTGEQLFMRHPDGEWKVSGPLRYANVLKDFYRICERGGVKEGIHLFGIETTVLGIEAWWHDECVSALVVGHVGDPAALPRRDDPAALSYLPSHMYSSLQARRCNVVSLEFTGGENDGYVASSVRVNPRLSLVNSHVRLSGSRITVGGQEVEYEAPVGVDLWAASNRGSYKPWVFRRPVMGERVAVLYAVGGGTYLSSPFRLVSTDGSTLYSEPNAAVVPGMSGGAIVALKDMALLGVHRGQSDSGLVGISVSEQMYDDIVEVMTRTRTAGDAGVLEMAESRGLAQALAKVAGAVVPVVNGKHLGSALVVADGLVSTTVSAVDSGLEVSGADPSVGSRVCKMAVDNVAYPVRQPREWEEVFVLGRDATGCFTSRVGKVSYVESAGRYCLVNGIGCETYPMAGAALVAMQDMAVVGQFCKASIGEDGEVKFAYCVSLGTSMDGCHEKLRQLGILETSREMQAGDSVDLLGLLGDEPKRVMMAAAAREELFKGEVGLDYERVARLLEMPVWVFRDPEVLRQAVMALTYYVMVHVGRGAALRLVGLGT